MRNPKWPGGSLTIQSNRTTVISTGGKIFSLGTKTSQPAELSSGWQVKITCEWVIGYNSKKSHSYFHPLILDHVFRLCSGDSRVLPQGAPASSLIKELWVCELTYIWKLDKMPWLSTVVTQVRCLATRPEVFPSYRSSSTLIDCLPVLFLGVAW